MTGLFGIIIFGIVTVNYIMWCVRQMRMVQNAIMIAVIHAYISITVVCTSNAYGSKWNNDSGH